MTERYEIRTMTPAEVATAVRWALDEGWNPGLADPECFLAVDAQGFIGGFLDGRMIAAISVVNYDDAFAFLGCYIVPESHRGRGYGLRLWQAAVRHAGDRLIGLDGVPAQIENYLRSGFELAYRNVRYGGWIEAAAAGPAGRRIVAAAAVPFEALAAYDRRCFPAPREGFLKAWISTPGHHALALLADDGLAGYGVIRACHEGCKVGPLFADDADAARTLLARLAAAANPGRGLVFLDVPEVNRPAVALAEGLGLTPSFETTRMYTGPAPEVALERIFGVSTFELG